jgi:hypothetical protein
VNDSLLDELLASQKVVSGMLRMAADDRSERVGAWSAPDIAAHLLTCDRDCFEPRIRAMAAGEEPHFGYFSDDETEFGPVLLEAVLEEWSATRGRLVDFVRGLSEEERRRTGVHERFGQITVDRYLEIALDHDRDHLLGLEKLAGGPVR